MRISKTVLGVIGLGVVLLLLSFNIGVRQKPEARNEILEALRAPANVILYSLNPDEGGGRPLLGSDKNALHGYRVLGSTLLSKEEAKTAIDSFRSSISDWTESMDACIFEPRHALRITAKGKTYDILLCYHCGDFAIYQDEASMAYRHLSGSPDVLNLLLTQAKVPIVKQSARP